MAEKAQELNCWYDPKCPNTPNAEHRQQVEDEERGNEKADGSGHAGS